MNQALIANPAYLLALPYSSFTAGIVMPREWGLATVYVWDPEERTKQGLKLDGLFSEGIILGTQVKLNTRFFDKPGEHHVGGIWKHVELPDLALAAPPSVGFPIQPVVDRSCQPRTTRSRFTMDSTNTFKSFPANGGARCQ